MIPNKKGAIGIDDYKSISWINNIYWISAKLLAKRLKRSIWRSGVRASKRIDSRKTTYWCFLIANEVFDSPPRNGNYGVLCKLDMEKAFDEVRGSYLLAVLKKIGFVDRWICWIKFCSITTTITSNIPNLFPRVGFGEGSVYTILPLPCGGRKAVSNGSST